MKRFGLIGHPIGHSVSPAVFSAGYKGKPYTYDLIEGEDFEESYRKFLKEYDGVNVTAPFKEAAFARADLHSPECEVIGATNLLIKTPDGVKAYNTDYYGVIFSIFIGYELSVRGIPPTPSPAFCRGVLNGWNLPVVKPRKALVVGCGGAGKAATAAAVNLGFETTLMNRTIEKALSTAEHINMTTKSESRKTTSESSGVGQLTGTPELTETPELAEIPKLTETPKLIVRPINDFAECFAESDLIIYTLPCPIDGLQEIAGSGPNADENTANATRDKRGKNIDLSAESIDGEGSHRRKLIIEANYREPSFNPKLISQIKEKFLEAEFLRGNIWHLYQAWSGYILLTGETPDLAAMAEVDK